MSDADLWTEAGDEPSVAALLDEPIMALLLDYDRLTADDVWAVVAEARVGLHDQVARLALRRDAA